MGAARVSHYHDEDSTPVPCSCLIKVTLVTCEISVIQFHSIEHRGFSPIFLFPPVVTLNP